MWHSFTFLTFAFASDFNFSFDLGGTGRMALDGGSSYKMYLGHNRKVACYMSNK
jgi:hypothetical protein